MADDVKLRLSKKLLLYDTPNMVTYYGLAVISVVDVWNDGGAGHHCILIWLPHHLKTGIFWTNIFLGIIEFNWAIFQLIM